MYLELRKNQLSPKPTDVRSRQFTIEWIRQLFSMNQRRKGFKNHLCVVLIPGIETMLTLEKFIGRLSRIKIGMLFVKHKLTVKAGTEPEKIIKAIALANAYSETTAFRLMSDGGYIQLATRSTINLSGVAEPLNLTDLLNRHLLDFVNAYNKSGLAGLCLKGKLPYK